MHCQGNNSVHSYTHSLSLYRIHVRENKTTQNEYIDSVHLFAVKSIRKRCANTHTHIYTSIIMCVYIRMHACIDIDALSFP